MIPVTTRKGQNIAVFGLGGSGMVTAEALIAGGATVCAFDDNPGSVDAAGRQGIPVGTLRDYDFTMCDALVLSPGIPLTHPEPHWSVMLAQSAGVPVIGDVALFAEQRNLDGPDSRFIAITGTNGKSSTTALVAHIFSSAGIPTEMGGNIGKAVLSLEPSWSDSVFVIECSSYQIDLAPGLDPQIGVLLNLAPDHLDRHGTMENYAEIKKRLVSGSQFTVIGVDDTYCAKIADDLENDGGAVFRISTRHTLNEGVFAQETGIFRARSGQKEKVADLNGITTLRGEHNAQNACAAYMACHLAGLSDETIQHGFETYAGLEHRMEILGRVGDILFVNDSKATNADAAAMALTSFDNVYWIAGGLEKEGGIDRLSEHFSHVAKAYLVGEAAAHFGAVLGGEVDYEISGTIDRAIGNAVKDAAKDRKSEPVILLSPACASFDQFQNFEKRGDFFRNHVERIKGFTPYGEQT